MKISGRSADQGEKRDLERDPSPALGESQLSVVVPAFNAARDLTACLDALRASDLPGTTVEIIVVDDSSTDDTLRIAAAGADRVQCIEGGARGPAFARNRGVELARAPIVAFVDSDVVVHRDALRLMMEDLRDRSIAAAFGSYDDSPPAPGVVSQYRNLLHHFTHQRSAGQVNTFWAGCGALRKSAFLAAGGFDEVLFRTAEMEDVELGYRLADSGFRTVLDPRILCTHRKAWSLRAMIVTDFARRGVPWTRILALRKGRRLARTPSLGGDRIASAMLASLFLAALVGALLTRSVTASLVAASALAGFILSARSFLSWLGRKKGTPFVIASIPLHLLYNIVAAGSLAWGTTLHLISPNGQARYTRPR